MGNSWKSHKYSFFNVYNEYAFVPWHVCQEEKSPVHPALQYTHVSFLNYHLVWRIFLATVFSNKGKTCPCQQRLAQPCRGIRLGRDSFPCLHSALCQHPRKPIIFKKCSALVVCAEQQPCSIIVVSFVWMLFHKGKTLLCKNTRNASHGPKAALQGPLCGSIYMKESNTGLPLEVHSLRRVPHLTEISWRPDPCAQTLSSESIAL